MIKMSDFVRAVNEKLQECFPEIWVDSCDLKEKYRRPSFRTEIDGLHTSPLGTRFKQRKFTIRIYFFPEKNGEETIQKFLTMDGLEEAFLDTLKVTKTFHIPVDELSFTETDGVLIMSFDTLTMEEVVQDITPNMMEELKLTVKNNRN